MTKLTRDDIRAAVGAGTISDAQAALLVTRAQVRKGGRGHLAGIDEPFELFRGFNELFIVAGLAVLFFGYGGFIESLRIWMSDLPIFSSIRANYLYPIWYGFFSLPYMAIAVFMAGYFTLRRRMVAPSVALAVIFFFGALVFGISIGAFVVELVNGSDIIIRLSIQLMKVWAHWAASEGVISLGLGIGLATATLLLAGYYFMFRVPFTLMLIALGALATVCAVTFSAHEIPKSLSGFLLISSEGPFGFLALALGLVFLAFAMKYDLDDPHRSTRRADCAFWLHSVAAISIMHAVASTFFLQETVSGNLILLLFVLVMSLFSFVIDRRIFIISGMGYFVALIFALQNSGLILMLLCLGLIYLCLGAWWEEIRSDLMSLLPDFPGKRILPPWDLTMANRVSPFSRIRPSARGIGVDDIRMAVNADIISDAQATSVMELARSRNDARRRTSGRDESFELFNGFNEIVIAVVFLILAYMWSVLSLVVSVNVSESLSSNLVAFELGLGTCALIGMYVTVRAARYYTVEYRMIAPSIALVVIFSIGARALGFGVSLGTIIYFDQFGRGAEYIIFAIIPTLLLAVYYFHFRVPFTMVLIALGTFETAYMLLALGWAVPESYFLSNVTFTMAPITWVTFATAFELLAFGWAMPESSRDLFLLSGEGPFAILTLILGLIFFAIATGFDMSDPHRVTRRAGAGFWTLMVAALAIVSTVALTLFAQGSLFSQLLLVLFVMLIGILAVVMERRSFLILVAGYIIALFIVLHKDSFSAPAFALVAVLGLGLVVLGSQWQSVRRWMMRVLPHFPGKNRLPPWDSSVVKS